MKKDGRSNKERRDSINTLNFLDEGVRTNFDIINPVQTDDELRDMVFEPEIKSGKDTRKNKDSGYVIALFLLVVTLVASLYIFRALLF